MSLTIEHHPNRSAAEAAAYRFIDEQGAARKRPVLLVDSYADVLRHRRALAQTGQGFGVAVSTLSSWLNDLWDLHGDGRTPVGSLDRRMMVWRLLQEGSHAGPLAPTPGMLDLTVRAAEVALPFLDEGVGLSERERAVVGLLKDYAADLERRGMIELCQASCLLKQEALESYAVALVDALPAALPRARAELLDRMGAHAFAGGTVLPDDAPRVPELADLLRVIYGRTDEVAPVVAGGAVGFAFAAGLSAENTLVARVVARLAEDHGGPIAVVSKDPVDLFDAIAPRLAKRGVGCAVSGSVPCAQTSMGKALSQLCDLVAEEHPDVREATDYLFGPVLGTYYGNAFHCDAHMRGDRLIDRDEVLSDLAGYAADGLKGVVGLIEERDVLSATSAVRSFVARRYATDPAARNEALAVLDQADAHAVSATEAGVDALDALRLLREVSVPISRSLGDDARVSFMGMDEAARGQSAGWDAVVIGNLSARDYPVKPHVTSLETLLDKLGCLSQADPLLAARVAFFETLSGARHAVVLERSLNDEKTEPSYPAVMLEEVVDCYRPHVADNLGIDRTLGIPQSLLGFVEQAGENDLETNVLGESLPVGAPVEAPETGKIGDEARSLIVLPRPGQVDLDRPFLSPSQIESYLECPYQWFAKRRLRIETLDEGFSALERGTFIHEVLRSFTSTMNEQGLGKTTSANLDQARQILGQVFEDCSRAQFDESRRHRQRYVPLDAWERRQRDGLLPVLRRYLSCEEKFLPTYRPTYFEWEYGKGEGLPYAGCLITGSIDRIDVDGEGNAVIIDYKSSLSDDYLVRDSEHGADDAGPFVLPRKMQALIYAKVARDLLGVNVVAALYVNPLTCRVAGAYDARFVGHDSIPFATAKDRDRSRVAFDAVSTFDELLEASENAVSHRLESLVAGEIAPEPLGPEACRYCPVTLCEKRIEG